MEGGKLEGGNGGRLSPGFMGMEILNKRAGIWKSHRYISEV